MHYEPGTSAQQSLWDWKRYCSLYPSLSVLRPHLHNRSYADRWEIRLKKQIAHLPEIKIVMKEIEAKLKELFEGVSGVEE